MSLQAYPHTIEDKPGLTSRQFLDVAKGRRYDAPGVKASVIPEWFKDDYGRSRGMMLVQIIKKDAQFDSKHVGTTGSHRNESDTLWPDSKASKP